MPDAGERGWVCCHLGAREHYAIPRALHRRHRLHLLVTDAWAGPASPWARLPGGLARRLSERFHPELADANVKSFTLSLAAREARWRSGASGGWEGTMKRNAWFGRRAARAIDALEDQSSPGMIVFAHSYSAREVLRAAKARGFTTVLGQIDPGEEHFRIAKRLADVHPEYGGTPTPPPQAYFDAWREECELADAIVVNSEWSRDSLERAGIARTKLSIVPLAYEPEDRQPVPDRAYPPVFTRSRPLRVLFVGHVSVVKGAPALLDAVARLGDAPVELRVVGAIAMAVPPRFLHNPAIHWMGAVPRHEVMRHYRECDVLVFPSHSDGFGMAQIEAKGWRLPIIASRHCGPVVQEGLTGMLLPEVSATAIEAALRTVLGAPDLLAGYARASMADGGSDIDRLGSALVSIAPE